MAPRNRCEDDAAAGSRREPSLSRRPVVHPEHLPLLLVPHHADLGGALHALLAEGAAHLALAQRYHPQSVELWVERANIELTRLHDFEAAAGSYRRAWEAPRGPYYAARLHAEMLRRAGKPAEALAWLVQLHPQLPPADDAAAADLVLARIRELERQLGVPAARAYRPHAR